MPERNPGRRRRAAATGVSVALSALLLTSCTAPSAQDGPTNRKPVSTASSLSEADAATFTFGTAAQPSSLDPALVADAESYRVSRQILQGLVGVEPLTSSPTPLLATDWKAVNDGRSYEFDLREDVTFHDGTAFNAEAVCANFDRWYHLPPSTRTVENSVAFGSVFGGFADTPKISNYEGCTVVSEFDVRIDLQSRFTGFIGALSTPAFGIASPTALKAQKADQLTQERNGVPISAYAQHPVGTGPYAFTSWDDGKVVLDAYPQYWGQKGDVRRVVFTTIREPEARVRALREGAIDGYDLVTAADVAELARGGQQILQRDPYSVLYLGMNQKFPGLDDTKMRQAVAHAIDKPKLLGGDFLNGTKAAETFLPPKLGVDSENATRYNYDPEKSRRLLAEAGYRGEPLPFYYPRNVTRAYLPTPEKVYAELSRQLTAVGLNIKPVPVAWSDGYVSTVQQSGDRAFHLLGWSGSYQDPDNFVGRLFGSYSEEFGFTDSQLFSKLDRARTLPPGPERTSAYADISDQIADGLPAVPLAFPISALAVSERVESYPVSPVMYEVFNQIKLR